MSKYWRLPKPEVLITVTGGAQNFALTQRQRASLDRGLVSAALSSNAWVFSAGSDAGVMKIVGEAMRMTRGRIPLIGVFPIGVTNGQDAIMRPDPSRLTTSHRGSIVRYAGGKATREGGTPKPPTSLPTPPRPTFPRTTHPISRRPQLYS